MNIDIETILMAIIILFVIDLLLVIQLILNKTKAKVKAEECDLAAQRYIHRLVEKDDHTIPQSICDGKRHIKHVVIVWSFATKAALNR